MSNWGMTNVKIIKEVHNHIPSWMVYADTDRFGKCQIMAQCISREEAEKWCAENGVEIKKADPGVLALFKEEMAKGWAGKIQIGNAMFRRLEIIEDEYYGYSKGLYGTTKITKEIVNCHLTGDRVGTTNVDAGRIKHKTVKFGDKCTW